MVTESERTREACGILCLQYFNKADEIKIKVRHLWCTPPDSLHCCFQPASIPNFQKNLLLRGPDRTPSHEQCVKLRSRTQDDVNPPCGSEAPHYTHMGPATPHRPCWAVPANTRSLCHMPLPLRDTSQANSRTLSSLLTLLHAKSTKCTIKEHALIKIKFCQTSL